MGILNTKSTGIKFWQNIFLAGLVACTAASCSDGTTGLEHGKGHMNVHLTDAPAEFDEVNVDVQGLQIHFVPDTVDTTASADTLEDDEGEWIDLPVDPIQVDLLELQNGVDTLLASADLEPGTYRELRLILGEDNNVVTDTTTHDLKVPSGQQSGYKIKFATELAEGESIDVTIDFDADMSIHQTGTSGRYILIPVLKAFTGDDQSAQP